MKPLPPAWATALARATTSGSSGRGNGIRSMTTSWQEAPGTSTPCHSDSVPNRQASGSAAKRRDELGRGVVALAQDRRTSSRVAHGLGGLLGRPHGREQPEGAAAGGLDQVRELVEQLVGQARRARAAAGARRRRESPAAHSRTASRRRGRSTPAASSPIEPEGARRTGSNEPPSVSVARGQHDGALGEELSRSSPATDSGARHRPERRRSDARRPDARRAPPPPTIRPAIS